MNAEQLECKVKRKKQKRARNPIPTISLENLSFPFGEESDPLSCPQLQTSASAECVTKFSPCALEGENARQIDDDSTEVKQQPGTPEADFVVEGERVGAEDDGELVQDVVADSVVLAERAPSEVSLNNNWAAIEIQLAKLPEVPETDFPDLSQAEAKNEEIAVVYDDQDLENLDEPEGGAEIAADGQKELEEEEEPNQEIPSVEELPLQAEEVPIITSSENDLAICDSFTNLQAGENEEATVSSISDYEDPFLKYKFVPRARETPTDSSMKAIIERLQFQNNYHSMKESIELTPADRVWSPILEKPDHVRLVYDYDVLKAMIDDDYAAQRRQQKLQLIAEASNVAGVEEELGFGSDTMEVSDRWRQIQDPPAFKLPPGVQSWETVRKHSDLYKLQNSRLMFSEPTAAPTPTVVPRLHASTEAQSSEGAKTLPRKSNAIQNVWAEVTFKCRQVWNAVKMVKRRASSLFRRKESGAQEAPLRHTRERPRARSAGAQKIPEIKLRSSRERRSLVDEERMTNLPELYADLQPEEPGWVLPPKRSERRHSAAPVPGASANCGAQHSTPNLYPKINGGNTSKSTGTRPKNVKSSSQKASRAKPKPKPSMSTNVDRPALDWLAGIPDRSSHHGKQAAEYSGFGGWIL